MAEPKVRFKRDDGSSYPAWTSGKLGDITEKVDRKAPKGSTAPVMMVSQGNGFVYQADKYSRENAGQSLKNYTLLKQGEFAYNHGASKAKPYGVACGNTWRQALWSGRWMKRPTLTKISFSVQNAASRYIGECTPMGTG